MRVLVTGGGGFIGPHLTVQLEKAEHEVTRCGFDCVPFEGNLLDSATLRRAFQHSNPQVVYHLAATVGRENGELMPSLTIENNVALTGSVARLCAIHGARMIYASSSEVYQPHNIYGWTKLWGEQIARYYLHSDVTCARISMPYGPGHPPGEGRAALTNFLWLALLGRPLRVHRGAMRSWCWIGDTCRALVKLLDEPPRVTTINIGRDDDLRPISAVAQLAVELTNSSSKILEFDLPPGFTPVKNLPCGKLRSLGWTPEIELRTGMEITRDWLASLEVSHGQLA